MTNHPNRNQIGDGPWKMMTWANGDGTGELTERRYASRKSAVAAANRLRKRHVVALIEHEAAKQAASHWRS